jgi:outer membrane protein X
MWDFSATGHYLFHINDKFTFYPLAGVSLLSVKTETKTNQENVVVVENSSKPGFNLGVGVDFKFTKKLSFNAESRYKFSEVWDRHLLSIGITYKL